MKDLLPRFKRSRLASNTLWMMMGQGGGLAIQALYFVLVARSLRAEGYGAFVGVVAYVGMLSPFSSLGTGNLLIKNVCRNEATFGRCYGRALLMVLLSGTILLLFAIAASTIVFPATIPVSLVFAVAVTDLFLNRLQGINEQAFQAFQRLGMTALLQTISSLMKLLGVLVLSLCLPSPTALHWGYLYLATSFIGTVLGTWLVVKKLGPPLFVLAAMKDELKEGFYFSVSLSAQGIYNDIDKTMLTRFSTLEATGIYGAAYRIIEVSFTPIRSLLAAAYAKFFQHGQTGIAGSLGFARKLFPVAGGYGLLAVIALMVAAPLLPYLLGEQYRDAADALRWLAPLPFLKAVHYFAADTLTGAGFQGVRSGLQVVVAVFNVLINLWLIPAYAWRGAAWSSIACDGLLALLLCLALAHLSRKKLLKAENA